MENNGLTLRFHHLLCIPLFEGKGYSGAFSENMARIKERAEASGEQIAFICGFDSVCENCPNKSGDGCLLNEEGEEKIEDKDKYIAALLQKKEGFVSDYKTALGLAGEKIGAAEFETVCGKCRWHKAGICSYDKWAAALKNMLC